MVVAAKSGVTQADVATEDCSRGLPTLAVEVAELSLAGDQHVAEGIDFLTFFAQRPAASEVHPPSASEGAGRPH